MKAKTRKLALTAVLSALYLVLSALIKIPVTGHITLDMGYIALTVGAVYLGAVWAMAIGATGALLESMLMSIRGVSPGWILMNAIAGYFCGLVLHKTVQEERKRFLLSAFTVIPASLFAGVVVKTAVDCVLYGLAVAAKIPSSLAAWITDSLVMLCIGIPFSLALKKRVGKW